MTLPDNFTVAQSIDEAFERIQFDPRKLVGEHLISARRTIRLMLDSWNNDSVLFWKVASNQQTTLALAQSSFTPVAGAIDILRASVLRSSYTTEITMISESDWFAIPDKGVVQGMPRMCWVQRTTTGAVANFYPQSENTTDIIVYDAMLQFNDSSQLAGSADIPFRWNECFVAGLTAGLAEKFAPALFGTKRAIYGGPGYTSPPNTIKSAYEIAKMGDRERGDTIMVLHKSRRARR